MKSITISIFSCFLACTALAQDGIDSILKAVSINNKSIKSNKQYWNARKAEFSTGLTPYDPQVEYDYLAGSPAGAGNQKDFSVNQRFDFPTTYGRKKELSRLQISQTDMQHQAFRQDILLQAKLVSLQLIYLNKKDAELNRRLTHNTQLVEDYQKKLDKGEVIILDVNKAKVQLLNIQNEVALNQNEINITKTRLTELNGGIPVDLKDTTYPALPAIPDFETLDSLIEANDPILKVYEQEKDVLQQQIAVQKSLNLPKIEAGYHSQGILGQSYRGVHAGITVPLWENKNKVKAAQASFNYATTNAETQRLAHRLENKQFYERLDVRKNAMQEYNRVVASLRNTELLDKALRLGQITIIQYFLDQNYYFSTYDKYLQLELEYHKAVAELYKFQITTP
jgi:outer membrane protein, heavy metal efflux system